eukprot:Skav204751  [mRNA]  locus=scaffold1013:171687:176508:- [translate_table: standard]
MHVLPIRIHMLVPALVAARWKEARTVVPVAISQPISVVFNNKAMVYAGAGVCAVIGTLSPVCTAVISSCCGRRLTVLSWAGVMIAFLGALVISWGEAPLAYARDRLEEEEPLSVIHVLGLKLDKDQL